MAKWIGQAVFFLLFVLGVGFFSRAPLYHYLDKNEALIRLSVSHNGQLVGECRQRTAEELNKLSRNMRALQDCPRERSPVTIAIEFDGKPLYHEVVQPSGLSHDGASTVYHRFTAPAGEHRLAVRVNDSVKVKGFTYQREEVVNLRASQVLVIDFNHQQGGVIIK
ncbi:MAG TPA: hypothetical protein VJ698_02280 [Noviherbaspirillum sp.]|uniref:hypothetical protein n=1 Tax=Noviherbaspirillum sp. TaxID=1926288 RepID=UPI002B483FA1|nr:hypothetical protein [Noviherbaspirillum sp.]HJV84275.1 hypothetical protein [Noviherbaspirillum sp.]